MSKLKKYLFQVELLFEPSFDSMIVSVEHETDDPDSIMNANWGSDFQSAILDNISIVPQSYEEE